jgi:L-threonylcarbamoyladenylate synthase
MSDEKNRELEKNIERAVHYLRRGGVVAAATETFFGFLADIGRPRAVSHIRKIKALEETAPLLIIVPTAAEVPRYCETWPPQAAALAEAYWPGPLTLIVRARMTFPKNLLGPYDTIALRVPGESDAADILRLFGKPLTATSCNRHGEPPTVTSRQTLETFEKKIDFIVPGSCPGGLPSTIVDTTVSPPVIRRRGIVSVEGKFLRAAK